MSYTRLLYHIVIRTKANEPTLSVDRSDDLYRYIWKMIDNSGGKLYRINGTADHLHILMSLSPTVALADFVREVKAATSRMLKHTTGYERFTAWSEGYAALTYSLKERDVVVEYIKNQREHHRRVSFREEYEGLLRDMGLSLDERDWGR